MTAGPQPQPSFSPVNDLLRVTRAMGEDPSMDEIHEMTAIGAAAFQERLTRFGPEVVVPCVEAGITPDQINLLAHKIGEWFGVDVATIQASVMSIADGVDPEEALGKMMESIVSFVAVWGVLANVNVLP